MCVCARAALGRDMRVVLRFVGGRDVGAGVDALRCAALRCVALIYQKRKRKRRRHPPLVCLLSEHAFVPSSAIADISPVQHCAVPTRASPAPIPPTPSSPPATSHTSPQPKPAHAPPTPVRRAPPSLPSRTSPQAARRGAGGSALPVKGGCARLRVYACL